MLSLFKIKKQPSSDVHSVYEKAIHQTRNPYFYEELKVPDTFEGRFDLLLIHVFLVMQPLYEILQNDPETQAKKEIEAFNQALFDTMFRNLDQSLRQMGIGDMGVPKHQRRMMLAFNGRMHAYQSAMQKTEQQLRLALAKNLYGNSITAKNKSVGQMAAYMTAQHAHLLTYSHKEIMNGDFNFKQPTKEAA